ncbi:MAG: hypothetical protein K2X38_04645 [Gemmataceae bacterium]|nr:hypothetical protein [Gemmataceae bacterium]
MEADAQRNPIVENRSRRPWLAADMNDVMHRQSGSDRNLRSVRIDLQIAVETEIVDGRHLLFQFINTAPDRNSKRSMTTFVS